MKINNAAALALALAALASPAAAFGPSIRNVAAPIATADANRPTSPSPLRMSVLPGFRGDDRPLVDRVVEHFGKFDLDGKGVLEIPEATKLFADVLGEPDLSMEQFVTAFRALERDILSNIDDQVDILDAVGWIRSMESSEEVLEILSKEGGAAALLRSAEMVTAAEKARLQGSLKKMSPYKDLLKIKVSEKLGGESIFEDGHAGADPEFVSAFTPLQLRSLALVSHNNMKSTMRMFVERNKNLLKKFRLTGTNSTMTMLREVFGDDPTVVYGRACKSGPLGGDAELVAAMCQGELGGMIFFQDPMESHMHSVDIECLNRQALIYNVMSAVNPTSALMMTNTLRTALKEGKAELIPSFLFTLECPTVEMYANQQKAVIQAEIDAGHS